MKTFLRVLFCAVIFFASFGAQAKLKVGVIFFDPPLVMSPTQGFNIDLTNLVCAQLKEECQIVPMDFNRLFSALDNKEIDLIVGVYITLDRMKKYIFSLPYMVSRGQFMALSSNKITSVNELKDSDIGILSEESNSGVFHNFANSNFPGWFTLVSYPDMEDLVSGLVDGSVRAALIHSTAVQYWAANSSGNFVAVGPSFNVGSGEAFMALPSNQALINNINAALKTIEANGSYLKIYKTYFPAD